MPHWRPIFVYRPRFSSTTANVDITPQIGRQYQPPDTIAAITEVDFLGAQCMQS